MQSQTAGRQGGVSVSRFSLLEAKAAKAQLKVSIPKSFPPQADDAEVLTVDYRPGAAPKIATEKNVQGYTVALAVFPLSNGNAVIMTKHAGPLAAGYTIIANPFGDNPHWKQFGSAANLLKHGEWTDEVPSEEIPIEVREAFYGLCH